VLIYDFNNTIEIFKQYFQERHILENVVKKENLDRAYSYWRGADETCNGGRKGEEDRDSV
jgi:hypothetical protein